MKTLVVKLGNEKLGWIPSKKYFDDIKYKLIQSGVLKKFDGYIITHFGTNFEIVDTDKMKIEKPDDYFEIKNVDTKLDNTIVEVPIPDIIEGLDIKITKDSLACAEAYLERERFNKEVDSSTIIESVLKIIKSCTF